MFIAILLFLCKGHSQEVIAIPFDPPEELNWEGTEKAYFSTQWDTQVVTNVSKPSMEVFLPETDRSNGTAVIIAPGGGLYVHGIENEGNAVARWLTTKGFTAFVLKYRLVPTKGDGVAALANEGEVVFKKASKVLPLATQDGLNAILHVRQKAREYGIDPHKIGFMGFSAGGAVTMNLTFNYTEGNRPDFVVPVYPWMGLVPPYTVPKDAPPMLLICASDDPLILPSLSTQLYSKWAENGKIAELHMYSKGGHGFGIKKQGLPSDSWIQRFYDWSVAEGLTTPKKE